VFCGESFKLLKFSLASPLLINHFVPPSLTPTKMPKALKRHNEKGQESRQKRRSAPAYKYSSVVLGSSIFNSLSRLSQDEKNAATIVYRTAGPCLEMADSIQEGILALKNGEIIPEAVARYNSDDKGSSDDSYNGSNDDDDQGVDKDRAEDVRGRRGRGSVAADRDRGSGVDNSDEDDGEEDEDEDEDENEDEREREDKNGGQAEVEDEDANVGILAEIRCAISLQFFIHQLNRLD
jgi:hypothetical protein